MLRHFAVLPVAIAIALATMLILNYFPGLAARRRVVLPIAVILVLVTAAVPHTGQRLYDLGFSIALIDQVETASLYVFVFAFSITWRLLASDRRRWFLIALLPVAFFNWFAGTFALLVWSIRGFGP